MFLDVCTTLIRQKHETAMLIFNNIGFRKVRIEGTIFYLMIEVPNFHRIYPNYHLNSHNSPDPFDFLFYHKDTEDTSSVITLILWH